MVFSSFKVKNYFYLKCHTPMPLMANVVYQFTCLRDANSTYIGKTIRHLTTRVREHTTSPSAIKEHLSSCTTCKNNYSCNSFKVIDSANSDFEVSIKEALYIKHKNPNLNKQLSTQGYVPHAKDLHIIGLNNNRIIGLNLNVTILNSLQLKY